MKRLLLISLLCAGCEGPGYPDASPPPGSLTVAASPSNLPNDGATAEIKVAATNLNGSPESGEVVVSVAHGQLAGAGLSATVVMTGGSVSVSYACAVAQDPGCVAGAQVAVAVSMKGGTASTTVSLDPGALDCSGPCGLAGSSDAGSNAGASIGFFWKVAGLPNDMSVCTSLAAGPMTITVSNGTPFPPVVNVPCTGPGSSANAGPYIYPTPLPPGVYAVEIEGLDVDGDGKANSAGTEKFCIEEGVVPSPITVELTLGSETTASLSAVCGQ